MNYRHDHIKIIQFLAKDLPKRTSYKVSDIAAKAFADVGKRKPDTELNPDRATRNALRKPRKEGHVEIAERGEYRLTPQGVTFAKKLDNYDVAPDRKEDAVEKKPAKKTKLAAKAEKKPAKPAKAEKKPAKAEKGKKTAKATKAEKKSVKGGGLRLPKSKHPENVAAEDVEQEDAEGDAEETAETKRPVGSELSI